MAALECLLPNFFEGVNSGMFALVEKASKIPPVFRSYGVVGISAGASTPDSVIDEIERELMKI
jgi:4-hydroxy-3-methylbut-2-enyl diphosphate reductase IspH